MNFFLGFTIWRTPVSGRVLYLYSLFLFRKIESGLLGIKNFNSIPVIGDTLLNIVLAAVHIECGD